MPLTAAACIAICCAGCCFRRDWKKRKRKDPATAKTGAVTNPWGLSFEEDSDDPMNDEKVAAADKEVADLLAAFSNGDVPEEKAFSDDLYRARSKLTG